MYNKTKMQHTPFAGLLDNLFNGEMSNIAEPKWNMQPRVNIRENADQFELQLMAPGLQKEDFNISMDKNLLSISFTQKEEKTEEQENWIRQEFKMNSFKRSFTVTDKIDSQAIAAIYANGILTLTLPKKEKEEAKVVSISVQ